MNAATASLKNRLNRMWGDHVDYEVYEPDPRDEYYDQMCQVAYATMFSKGGYYASDRKEDYLPGIDSAAYG